MAQDDLGAAIDRLHAVSLDEFVPERTRLAKELKAGGEKSAAAELAKLPKPTAAAWALNHVAREDPDAVAEWLDAAEALREASNNAAEVGGDALREAMAAHRDATGHLAGVVRDRAQPGGKPLSEAMIERVRTLLQKATADPQLADLLRSGRVTEEKAPADIVLRAEPAPERKRPPAAAKPAPPKRDREAERRAKRRAEVERLVAATEKEIARLHKETGRREAAAARADERLEEATRVLRRSESEAAAAHDAVKDAEDAAATAEGELRELRAELESG